MLSPKRALGALVCLVVAASGGEIRADFIGNTIGATYHFPDSTTISTPEKDAVVGSGIEFQPYVVNSLAVNIDVSATNIRISDFTIGGSSSFGTLGLSGIRFGDTNTFNGFEFNDVNGTIPDITGVTINPESTMGNLDASEITFDANHIFLNWGGDTFSNDTVVSLDIQFNGPAMVAPLPASAGSAAALLGVLLLARFAKRRRLTAEPA